MHAETQAGLGGIDRAIGVVCVWPPATYNTAHMHGHMRLVR